MMSVGFSSLPAIFLIASSSRVLSYVMSIAIDEGPLETMPNMSPSCTSSFEIFLNSSRTRPVLWNCRCRSSTKNRKMRPDTSFLGRLGGRMMPSGGGGGGGASTFVTRPPVTTVIDDDVLLDAVLVDLELVLLQVGDEIPLLVADDDVVRDEIDLDLEGRFFLCSGGVCGLAGAGACADRPATRTTESAVDQKPFIFKLIAVIIA